MKLHHVGIVTEDIESGIQRYKAMFGFVPVTERLWMIRFRRFLLYAFWELQIRLG